MRIPVQYFTEIAGSMTSDDGQNFYYRAKRDDGQEYMLGFPHECIPTLVECAAMQMDKGHAEDGRRITVGFNTSGFIVGRGPNGETVLTLQVGETGKISFLLPGDMPSELVGTLGRTVVKH
jgi:hypothetical protein